MTNVDSFHQINQFNLEVERWVICAKSVFGYINDGDLPPEDQKRLKEYYLGTCVNPRMKAPLKKHFPEDFPTDQRVGQPTPPRSTTP